MPRLLMGDVELGSVVIQREDSATRWTGFLKPNAAYPPLRKTLQFAFPRIANTANDPREYLSAFAKHRESMRHLGLRLVNDEGDTIETSEIILGDLFPSDAPAEFFAVALVALDIHLPA